MYNELREAWQEMTAPGAPFEVVEIEVRGNKLRAYKNAMPSVRHLWQGSALHGSADYLVYENERWSYSDAHRDVASLGAWLVDQGVQPGDRVAIAMRNYPEWMLLYWACASIGAVAVGMNAWWTSAEMQYALEDSAPKVVFCDAERLERLLPIRAAVPQAEVVAIRCDAPPNVHSYSSLLGGGDLPEVEIDPDSDVCLFYTSGTTGKPKGAQLTHRGCTNNLMSILFWQGALIAARVKAGAPKPEAKPDPPQPSALIATPLFHVTANNCGAYPMTLIGGKLVTTYKWDPGQALEIIERERITNFSGVPTMTRELLAHPDLEKHDTSSLATLGGGGAKFQADLVEKVESRKGATRSNTGYGLTEVSGIITANTAEYLRDKPETVGPAMPCYETRIVDDAGNDAPAGSPGELWVRGAQVVAGYWNRPEATAEDITDGWFHTGDIATIDEDGFIEIVDRKKEMVLRGGENVYCSEVESALFEHPAVAEAAVFGVPDERLGEEVGAAAVIRPGASLSAEELRTWCGERLAKFKIPKYLWMRSEPLPRNANGKFVKRELKEQCDVADAR